METTHPLDQPGVRSLIVASLNVTKQVISNWKARGVPAEYCPQIEALTNGQVRCEDLRPDVQWSVLRRKAKPVKPTPATTEAA